MCVTLDEVLGGVVDYLWQFHYYYRLEGGGVAEDVHTARVLVNGDLKGFERNF
jgi:hypothetical protein